jgi:hypothetical protein
MPAASSSLKIEVPVRPVPGRSFMMCPNDVPASRYSRFGNVGPGTDAKYRSPIANMLYSE